MFILRFFYCLWYFIMRKNRKSMKKHKKKKSKLKNNLRKNSTKKKNIYFIIESIISIFVLINFIYMSIEVLFIINQIIPFYVFYLPSIAGITIPFFIAYFVFIPNLFKKNRFSLFIRKIFIKFSWRTPF